MIALLVIAACPISAAIGAFVGFRYGQQGLRVTAACIRAWERSALTLGLGLFGLVTVLAIWSLMSGSDLSEALNMIGLALLASAIFGALTSVLPAPMAAFIAHNFGTQKRIRDELAKPPATIESRKPWARK